MAMEFWGIEVPSGKPTICRPTEDSYIHVTQVALGESKSGKGNERVVVRVKVGANEVVIGTLLQGRCDQITVDFIFDREFVLLHNSSASIYFCGYTTEATQEGQEFEEFEDEESGDSDEEEDDGAIQLSAKGNRKPTAQNSQIGKGKHESKEKKGKANGGEDDDEDDDVSGMDSEGDELQSDEEDVSGEEEESDEDDASEEEQLKRKEKKRPAQGSLDARLAKKAKSSTPPTGKVEFKPPATLQTLTPNRQPSGKKELPTKKSPKSENNAQAVATGKKAAGQHFCQACKKNFASENALSQHNSAKHKA